LFTPYFAEYSSLNFPNTPPPYAAAMDLASKFGSFSLDEEMCCSACGAGVRARCLSMDGCSDDPSEMKMDDTDHEEKEEECDAVKPNRDGDPRTEQFSYEGYGYCNLNCFFKGNKKKPGLCMYVDKLATVLLEFNRKRADSEASQTHK